MVLRAKGRKTKQASAITISSHMHSAITGVFFNQIQASFVVTKYCNY